MEPPTLDEAVAMTFLRPHPDTRVPRAFKRVAGTVPGVPPPVPAEHDDPRAPWMTRVLRQLEVPPADASSCMAQARDFAQAALERARHAGIDVMSWWDPRYPPLLREIVDPPIVLWTCGDFAALHLPAVAIVGARAATPAGVRVAREMAEGLAAVGLVVTSGLARGIDAAAHEGALGAGGVTVAVVGCGVDVRYPRENAQLAERACEKGAIVSELPPGAPPRAEHFPRRNRIISGLSRAVAVIEAGEKSGSLITARAALEQGREVFAVPGNVPSGASRGCHALIKDGAPLVETVKDVLNALGWAPRRRNRARVAACNSLPMSELEESMAAGEGYTIDELVERTGAEAASVLAELTALELDGRVSRLPGGQFTRT